MSRLLRPPFVGAGWGNPKIDLGGCVLYLPLWRPDMGPAGGGTIYSKDSYGHTCTVTGAVWTPQGRYFDGVDDKITIPDHNALDITGNLTIEIWLKIHGLEDNAGILQKGVATPSFAIDQYSGVSNRLDCKAYDVDGNFTRWVTGAVAAFDTFFHFVFISIQNADTQGHVNGISNGAAEYTRADKALRVNASDLLLGTSGNVGTQYYSNITIGEIRIYNRALSASEREHNRLATKWRYQ